MQLVALRSRLCCLVVQALVDGGVLADDYPRCLGALGTLRHCGLGGLGGLFGGDLFGGDLL